MGAIRERPIHIFLGRAAELPCLRLLAGASEPTPPLSPGTRIRSRRWCRDVAFSTGTQRHRQRHLRQVRPRSGGSPRTVSGVPPSRSEHGCRRPLYSMRQIRHPSRTHHQARHPLTGSTERDRGGLTHDDSHQGCALAGERAQPSMCRSAASRPTTKQ